MSGTTIKANVYYLPAAEAIETPEPPSRWSRLHARLTTGWWRARLSLTDLRIGRGARRRHDEYSALFRSMVEDGPAEMVDRRRTKPSRPAKVLDFESARLRLRPNAV